jgi:hypothetical protein
LIRLDSAKEIQGFPLLEFGWALLDETRIWLDLGLAGKKFGLSARVRKSFITLAPVFLPSPRSWQTPKRLRFRVTSNKGRRSALAHPGRPNPAMGLWLLTSESWY